MGPSDAAAGASVMAGYSWVPVDEADMSERGWWPYVETRCLVRLSDGRLGQLRHWFHRGGKLKVRVVTPAGGQYHVTVPVDLVVAVTLPDRVTEVVPDPVLEAVLS